MRSSQSSPVRRLFVGVIGIGTAAVIGASADSASATTATPAVRASSTSLHVTPSRAIRVGVTAHHARRADRLVVQQYYRHAWRPITVLRVRRAAATLRHSFDLGRAPAGRYLVRVAMIRNAHRVAKTPRITITCREARPPAPPVPPAPPGS